ncbi:acyl-CoA thioesterase [Marinigracilibium pacificum]|uniref:Thioesterase n=1 Tax=Marinigracilibium pacificum TaxID=2729599 RepID=A0A848J9Z1_9BACT|nr:acyl-CoA thioesterase [Marinigracilibium pacificum]NMM49862.1 thioesterase [Marinigracilibium pacificum]
MQSNSLKNVFEVRWSDIDANIHLRHSAYADFCAQARLRYLSEAGLTFDLFKKLHIGPVLFREELKYLREVPFGEHITVETNLLKIREDASRWTIKHVVYREDGVKAAEVIVEGAWIDILKRKLTTLPEEMTERFKSLPKSEDFEIEPLKASV